VQIGLGLVSAFGALATAWIFAAGTLEVVPIITPGVAHDTSLQGLLAYLQRFPLISRQLLSVFMRHANPLPIVTGAVWLLGSSALLAAALRHGRGRVLVAIGMLATAVVLAPGLISAKQIRVDGLIWGGRYSLPIVVGMPILAAVSIPRLGRLGVRASVAGNLLVAGAIAAAFFTTLVRYVRGVPDDLGGWLHPFAHVAGSWRPLLPPPVLLALAVTATLGWAVLLSGTLTRTDSRPPPGSRAGGGGRDGRGGARAGIRTRRGGAPRAASLPPAREIPPTAPAGPVPRRGAASPGPPSRRARGTSPARTPPEQPPRPL